MKAKIVDCSPEQYHSDRFHGGPPTLSYSLAKTLLYQSPAHAWQQGPRFGNMPKKPSDAMDKGNIIGTLILGEGKDIAIIPYKDYRTNAAKELRDAAVASGKIPVKQDDFYDLDQAAGQITKNLADLGIVLDGKSEVPMLFEQTASNGNVVLCRAMVDHVKNANEIYDLKTTYFAHPKAIANTIMRMGYTIQHEAYLQATGADKMMFLFCEVEPPYAVTPVFLLPEYAELGKRQWQRAVDLWEQCLRTNRWPAYVTAPIGLDAPTYALYREQMDAIESEHEDEPTYNLSEINPDKEPWS